MVIMGNPNPSPVGLTRETGWQIGLRRTLSVPAEILEDFLLSPEGIKIWLGPGSPFTFSKGARYKLFDGTSGEVRVLKRGSHWRITRLPPDKTYSRPATIQIRIISKGDRAILAFHEENLPDQAARETRRLFFMEVIEKIKDRWDPA